MKKVKQTKLRDILRKLALEECDRIAAAHAEHAEIVQPTMSVQFTHRSRAATVACGETRGILAESAVMPQPDDSPEEAASIETTPVPAPAPREIGGPEGPEPTRYGDWERRGRCIDF